MAQTEDTELRDLVLETLEKNGSLAKVRALLRANIFLAFEDEHQKSKQNVNLDNILSLPEGILALSIIHEFLEFCNLKNTLFVYMSESRQGKDYRYEGHKLLANKLNLSRDAEEPLLLSLLKTSKVYTGKYYEQGDVGNIKQDEDNCTYIVHEDSSCTTTSQSQSDNSSDEKNKLHLRLHLDNSDTDTSSDSARDKSCSEYIPSEHIIKSLSKCDNNCEKSADNAEEKTQTRELSLTHLNSANNNSTSESTSYLELKPLNALDHKMLNTPGVPYKGAETNSTKSLEKLQSIPIETQQSITKVDPISPATLSNVSSLSFKMDTNKITIRNPPDSSISSDKVDYSFDFSSSPSKNNSDNPTKLAQKSDEDMNGINKNTTLDSPHQNSQSSQSSISISDVADLISEKSTSYNQPSTANEKSPSHYSEKKIRNEDKENYDSGEFSDSPIPSLSNLSLDIHSD